MARRPRYPYKWDTWVEFQQLNKAVIDYDPTPAEWRTIYGVRVHFEPTGGREIIDGQRIQAQTTHILHLRYMPRIRPEWRAVVVDRTVAADQQRTLQIQSVVNVQERSRYLFLQCVETPRPDVPVVINPDFWEWQDGSIHTWQDDSQATWQAGSV